MVNQLEISFGGPLRIVVAKEEDAPAISARLSVLYEQFKITGETIMYALPIDHTVRMQISYIDAAGNPARIDGEVTWTSSDESVATVKVDSADSSIVQVLPVTVGQMQIRANADADLGAGVRNLLTVADVEIVAGEAVAGSVQPLGEPEPMAPHAAPRKK
jgi:hypothetical protein